MTVENDLKLFNNIYKGTQTRKHTDMLINTNFDHYFIQYNNDPNTYRTTNSSYTG